MSEKESMTGQRVNGDCFLLGIDQGTTGSTVLVIKTGRDKPSTVIGRATVDFAQHFPKEAWVEHDATEIWASVTAAGRQALTIAAQNDSDFSPSKISAIGITNQRETVVAFDRKTGEPLARAIVWQCRRTAESCAARRKRGLEATVREKTGLVLDPYFSASKIEWLLENNPDVKSAADQGQLAFGTIDTFLLHRLTGGASFATEPSNASRTMLFNIKTGSWDEELLSEFKIPGRNCLPEIRDSAGVFGHTKGLDFLPDGIPVSGILGDQQAALAGQACFAAGEAKCTYGTGAFLLLNTGSEIKYSSAGMLSTVAWALDGRMTYALEGSAFIAGAAIQFLRDQLHFLKSSAESEGLARKATAAPTIYFVPALSGLGAPWWDAAARGAFFGLTRGTTQAQLVRAALESIALQVSDLIEAMAKDLGQPVAVLKVDGGAAANNLLMQLQSEYCNLVVDRPKNIETTAFGAAMFAALGVGIYDSLDDLSRSRMTDNTFSPGTIDQVSIKQTIEGWHRAIRATQVFAGSQ